MDPMHNVQKKGLKQSLTSLKLVLLPSEITILVKSEGVIHSNY